MRSPSFGKGEVTLVMMMMMMRWRDDWRWDDVKTLIGHIKPEWVGGWFQWFCRYLALAFGPFPRTPPPLSGFLQSLQVRRLIHLGPGLLNVSRGVSHGRPLSAPTRRRLKLLDHFQKSSQNACRIGRPVIHGNQLLPRQVTFFSNRRK